MLPRSQGATEQGLRLRRALSLLRLLFLFFRLFFLHFDQLEQAVLSGAVAELLLQRFEGVLGRVLFAHVAILFSPKNTTPAVATRFWGAPFPCLVRRSRMSPATHRRGTPIWMVWAAPGAMNCVDLTRAAFL